MKRLSSLIFILLLIPAISFSQTTKSANTYTETVPERTDMALGIDDPDDADWNIARFRYSEILGLLQVSDLPSGATLDTEWDTWAEHPSLADGYVLVGNASNQATATDSIDSSLLDVDLQDLADGELSKSKVEDSGNWDTAYGWGDHSAQNYLDLDDTRTANTVLAGPTSGAAAAPTFRALVDDDVPDTITASNYSLTSHNHDVAYQPDDVDLDSLASVSKIDLILEDTITISSADYSTAIVWTGMDNTGEVQLRLENASSVLEAGTYLAYIVVYDSTNTLGIVWDEFRLVIKDV